MVSASSFGILLLACVASATAFAPPSGGIFNKSPALRAGVATSPRNTCSLSSLSMARRPFIAGNWKMNPNSVEEAKALATAIMNEAKGASAEVLLCVPHPYLYTLAEVLKGSNVEVGAQSAYFEEKGAFTGAVSTSMIKSVGATHVLAGHSERRVIFKNDDTAVNRKTLKILNAGLDCMLCIGESKEEYEGKLNKAICATQLSKDLKGVTKEQMKRVSIAYEPVWAIGTGLTCDPQQAQDVHAYVRSWVAELYDQDVANEVRILYGGSVTPDTVDELMAKPDIDGCLVGGASLDASKFGRIINFK